MIESLKKFYAAAANSLNRLFWRCGNSASLHCQHCVYEEHPLFGPPTEVTLDRDSKAGVLSAKFLQTNGTLSFT